MIVTVHKSMIDRNVACGNWKIEELNDGVETKKITMKDETEWFCWFDPTDWVVQLIEEFTSSVETALTGGKKNYY